MKDCCFVFDSSSVHMGMDEIGRDFGYTKQCEEMEKPEQSFIYAYCIRLLC